MLNGVAGGTLIVVNTYYQSQLGFSSLQAGLISITLPCSCTNHDSCW